MTPKKLVYLCSLRNAAADRAGQWVDFKGEQRYMTSPLEHLVRALNETPLGDAFTLEAVIYDDDEGSARDREKVGDYGFTCRPGAPWVIPPSLCLRGAGSGPGRRVNDLLVSVPSTYRRLPLAAPERAAGKQAFENALLDKLQTVGADWVVLDGLLVILDSLVRPGAPYSRRVLNIHPGLTTEGSPYERRGAYATLDALYGARGRKVINWQTLDTVPVPVINRTGASFHYVDQGVDSGEVILEVLNTHIDPEDTILELRWKNFHHSLFPALVGGLQAVAGLGDGR